MDDFCVTLPRFVLDKSSDTDWNFPIFEDDKGRPIPAEFVIDPRFPTVRVVPWVIVRTPNFRQYMAQRFFDLNLDEHWVPDFLDHTIQYADVNVLKCDDTLIDLEKIISDHLVNSYGKRDCDVERGWWGDFLECRHRRPKHMAQVRMKARYSLLALGLQLYDLTPQTRKL